METSVWQLFWLSIAGCATHPPSNGLRLLASFYWEWGLKPPRPFHLMDRFNNLQITEYRP